MGYLLGYSAWIAALKLLIVTLVTFFMRSSGGKFQEITETLAANELTLMGFGAFLYIIFLRWMHPLTSLSFESRSDGEDHRKKREIGHLHDA